MFPSSSNNTKYPNKNSTGSQGSFAPLSMMINDEDSMRGAPSQRQLDRQQEQAASDGQEEQQNVPSQEQQPLQQQTVAQPSAPAITPAPSPAPAPAPSPPQQPQATIVALPPQQQSRPPTAQVLSMTNPRTGETTMVSPQHHTQQRQPFLATGTIVNLPPNNSSTPQTTFNTGGEEETHYETTYRGGFSTSICDLFQDPRDRSSCCAITCCGTFLSDRNKFLLTGELPPPWWFRIVVYLGGFLAAITIGHYIDPSTQILLPMIWVAFLTVRATHLRQDLRTKLQLRMLEARGVNPNNPIHTHGGRCEHLCCALVSNDKRQQLVLGPTPLQQEQQYRELYMRQQTDFCWKLWQFVAACCCDTCCYSWCHFNGMCATAQEDRELKRLLPPEVFMRDYITFQPFGEYYPAILALRQQYGPKAGFLQHLQTISELSTRLLLLLQSSLLVLVIVATLRLVKDFVIEKVFVVILTLAQAFFIVYLVWWRNHRQDVSLDAIIKFFASGFVLAVTVAMAVEMIVDSIGEIVFSIVMTNEYIEDHPEVLEMDDDYAISQGGPFSNMDTFKALAQEHYIILVIYLFFKAVVVAGLVEELSKYYCYWMVEHPDYIWGDRRHVNEEMGNEGAFCNEGLLDTTPASTGTSGVRPPTSPSEAATTNMPPFRPRDPPPHTTAGAMITVGMIATAAGFSCSENLMYVFSENSVAGEVTVLMARSLMPVHSICAAIQSIGVVRRDVEQDPEYRIGWAILPAVVLHGLFDWFLFALSFFEYIYSDEDASKTTATSNNPNEPDDDFFKPISNGSGGGGNAAGGGPNDYKETPAQQILSFSIAAGLTLIGIVFYITESAKQRHRLQALEMTTAQAPSTATMVFT